MLCATALGPIGLNRESPTFVATRGILFEASHRYAHVPASKDFSLDPKDAA